MLYFLKLALFVTLTVPAALATILLGLFDPQGKRVYGIGRFWAWSILALGGVAVKVRGAGVLDCRQPYLFVVNHQSNIDIPVLVRALAGFQLRWVAKKELLWVPLFGWAMWAGKHIAVDRADAGGALSTLKKAAARIDHGISVVVFPEGTRSVDGRLLPFKRGSFLLAVKTRAPVVPVAIRGTRNLLPKGGWRLRAGTVEVHVGAPIPTAGLPSGSVRALVEQTRGVIEKNLAAAGDRHQPRSATDALVFGS
jgi:1-acyl-sn-glycerol-3-phosphate acyltransferase